MPARIAQRGIDRTVRIIRGTRGLPVRIAKACGIERAAVYQWKRVPPQWVHKVAEVLGRTPEEIRPDIYPPPKRKRRDS